MGRNKSVETVPREAKNDRNSPASLVILLLLNTGLSVAIGTGFLRYGGDKGPLEILQFAANFIALNLAVSLIALIIGLPFGRWKKYAWLALFGLLQVFLFADLKVYELFRFHINSLVWNMVTTEGVSDSVIVGTSTYLYAVTAIAVIFFIEWLLVYFSSRASGAFGTRLKVAVIIIFGLSIVADKMVFAFGELYNIQPITRAERLYPLYQPLNAERTLSRLLHIKVSEQERLRSAPQGHGNLLHYPKKPLVRVGDKRDLPNVVLIAVEGFRFDMLNPSVTPNLWKFGRENVIFTDHYSGGNGSRAGVFSLLYGLQASYWHDFLIERRSPVLIDSLMSLGYRFKILSATRLTFPEFRKTAFVKIPEDIEDELQAKGGAGRDRVLAERFIDFISKGDASRPFFSFMFFNASHQPYAYPKVFEKFTPAAPPEINYVGEVKKANAALLRNRYKNALHYDDSLFGRIFSALREKGVLDNTIVIVTGDHGEEFFEQGYFGHTSSFDDYETKTAFVVHMPGDRYKGMEVRKLTSHLDVVPTIMKALGYTNDPSDYADGIPLFDEREHPYVFSAGWDRLCMIDKNVKVVFGTQTYRGTFDVLDSRTYKPEPDADRILKAKKGEISDVLRRMSAFYK
ncbi:MAG: sulfatase-like hydrolase/transferase [Candidatus Sulfobium sp.]